MPDTSSDTARTDVAAMGSRRSDAYQVFEDTHVGVFGNVSAEQRRRIADALAPLVTADGTRVGAITLTVQHCRLA